MGRILDKMQKDVLDLFERQKDTSDLTQLLHRDGLGFTIIRADNFILEYDGSLRKFIDHTKKECV